MTEEPHEPLPTGRGQGISRPARGRESHYTLLYDDEDEQLSAAARFVRRGIRRDEKCVYLLGDRAESELVSGLRSRGIDVAAARDEGLLSFQRVEDTFLVSEDPTPETLRDGLEGFLEAADDERALRIIGEMTPAVESVADPATICEYEEYVGDLIERWDGRVTAFCQYDCDGAPDELLRGVLTRHPRVQTSSGRCENVFYEPGAERTPDDGRPEGLAHAVRTLDSLSAGTDGRTGLHRLRSLSESVRRLDDCGRTELLETLVDSVADVCTPTVATVWLYDESTGSLRPEDAYTEGAHPDPGALLEEHSELAWETFSEGGFRSGTLSTQRPGAADAERVESSLTASLGQHGVLMVLLPDRAPVSAAAEATVQTAVTEVRLALDALTYRREADERGAELAERERRIDRLETWHSILRRTRRRILDATTRTDIERVVCERLVDASLFDHAWIGEYNERAHEIVVRYAAPDGKDDPWTGVGDEHNPALAAAQERDPVFRDDVHGDPPFEPWQNRALRHGIHSVGSVPLIYRDSLYGALTVSSGDPEAFDQDLRIALRDLGREVAHAINGREAKQALISDQVTELELRIRDETLPMVSLASRIDATVSFEGFVPRVDGSPRVYVTVDRCRRSVAESAARRLHTILDVHHVSSGDDGHVFAFTVGGTCFFQNLLEHGGVPSEMETEGDEALVTVELPQSGSVRSFLSMLTEQYGDVNLRAQRSRERTFRTRDEFREAFDRELTDRQREIVRTAYYSGFFDAPRESTGEDLADQLDVSQPTVTEHIRAAERELFSLLFDSDDGDLSK